MAPALPRTSFNSSRLVRLLADLDVADVAESKQSFAERLGLWLDLTDAISLSAALKPVTPKETNAPSGEHSSGNIAVQEEFDRVRAALVDSMTSDDGPKAGKARTRLPIPAPGTSIGDAGDFSLYHRYYLAHQRDMDANIGPLRAKLRALLAGVSPTLGQLAALDAVLDEALGARERSLLSTVPLLLEKRFEHLRGAHQAWLAETTVADDPELWMQPGGWLAVFCRDMQSLLLAELELRLQPVVGLMEAIGNKVTKHQ